MEQRRWVVALAVLSHLSSCELTDPVSSPTAGLSRVAALSPSSLAALLDTVSETVSADSVVVYTCGGRWPLGRRAPRLPLLHFSAGSEGALVEHLDTAGSAPLLLVPRAGCLSRLSALNLTVPRGPAGAVTDRCRLLLGSPALSVTRPLCWQPAGGAVTVWRLERDPATLGAAVARAVRRWRPGEPPPSLAELVINQTLDVVFGQTDPFLVCRQLEGRLCTHLVPGVEDQLLQALAARHALRLRYLETPDGSWGGHSVTRFGIVTHPVEPSAAPTDPFSTLSGHLWTAIIASFTENDFRALCQQSQPRLPTGGRQRLLSAVWMTAAIIFCTCYTRDLVAHLSQPPSMWRVDSLADLVRRNYRVIVNHNSNSVLGWLEEQRRAGAGLRAWSRGRAHETLTAVSRHPARRLAFIGPEAKLLDIPKLLQLQTNGSLNDRLYVGRQHFLITPSAVGLRRGLPLARFLSSLVSWARDTGLIEAWQRRANSARETRAGLLRALYCREQGGRAAGCALPAPHRPLSLRHVQGVLVLLLAGLGSALAVFALELALVRWQRRRGLALVRWQRRRGPELPGPTGRAGPPNLARPGCTERRTGEGFDNLVIRETVT
ncbi:hypothetical protein FJT64_012156 [Amphibalanus amphitrite]|uniref:Ionotropic glutamate receptor C-terminal domain-containing protein n=1 Tax=Amphibalanus amphitrite TaxID=1232801 RepID=A0A6A4V7F8_AMPAM|nr:hypothetical protein FJT64_012156 [Amphibalanus amphitrite]